MYPKNFRASREKPSVNPYFSHKALALGDKLDHCQPPFIGQGMKHLGRAWCCDAFFSY